MIVTIPDDLYAAYLAARTRVERTEPTSGEDYPYRKVSVERADAIKDQLIAAYRLLDRMEAAK